MGPQFWMQVRGVARPGQGYNKPTELLQVPNSAGGGFDGTIVSFLGCLSYVSQVNIYLELEYECSRWRATV